MTLEEYARAIERAIKEAGADYLAVERGGTMKRPSWVVALKRESWGEHSCITDVEHEDLATALLMLVEAPGDEGGGMRHEVEYQCEDELFGSLRAWGVIYPLAAKALEDMVHGWEEGGENGES
jgi:hypothetical protein